MKQYLLLFAALILLASGAVAQTKPIKIVFDLTSGDTLVHQATIRHVKGEAKAHPDGKFEVVIYGGSLNMVVKDKSTVAAGVQELLANKNVSFKVCQETMKRYKVEKTQLFSGVDTVPDGIVEIVDRQGEGWGYIKEAH